MFTAAIVLTLGVCIGALTAVVSIVDSTLLRPLPYPSPERLAQLVVRTQFEGREGLQNAQNGATWEFFSKSARTIDLAVYSSGTSNLNFSSGGKAGYVRQQRVGSGFFRVFGVPLLIGREFLREEDLPNGPPLAILSHGLWQRAFGSDRDVIGRKVEIAGISYQIVGVASSDFESTADLWTPLRPSTRGEGQGINYVIAGRLRQGVTWAQADAEMRSIGQPLLQQSRFRPGVTAQYGLMSLQEAATQSLADSLWIVLAAAFLVLVIGCVNVAGMLMARGVSRAHELATRMAIGATRSMIVRQLLSESLILAVFGGAAGIVIGYVALEVIKLILPPAFSALQTVRMDVRSLVAVSLISIMTSILFGLLPAFQAGRVDVRLAHSSRTVSGSRSFARRVLSTVQIAIAAAILIGAGLLVRSFSYLSHLDPGLDATNVIVANFALLDARYSRSEAAGRYFDEVLQRLQAIPGVEAAAVSHSLPYERGMNTVFNKTGEAGSDSIRLTNWSYVSPQFFDLFRIRILRGRGIQESDRTGTLPVAVVNEAFAKMYFRNEDAIGARVHVFGEDLEIVGIAGDVLQQAGWGNFGPIGRVPTIYIPAAQPGPAGLRAPSPSWVVRTWQPAAQMQKQIEQVVQSVDPLLPVAAFRSLQELNVRSLGLQRFTAALLAITAGLALLLAGIGTYAMISNSVAERTREFGIRLALGATLGQAVRESAAAGWVCALIGSAIGLILARMGTGMLRGMLYGIAPVDLPTYVVVAAAVLAIATLASLLPALKILKVDPAETLRFM